MRRTFLLFFLLLFQALAWGQTFKFNKQIKGFGRIPNQIYSIDQDERGFVWVASNRGVQYSDGIASLQLPDSIKAAFSTQQKIRVDDDGMVWVYQTAGQPMLYHFNMKSWQKANTLLSVVDTAAVFDEIHFFPLGKSENKQLFMVLPNQIIYQKHPSKVPVNITTDGLGEYYSHFVSDTDTLFLFQEGVYQLKNDELRPKSLSIQQNIMDPLVQMVYAAEADSYFFLTENAVYEGDHSGNLIDTVRADFRQESIGPEDSYDLFFRFGKLYFYFNSHLFQYNLQTRRVFELSVYDDLRTNQINTALVDREGIIWLGTFRGLANLASTRFQNFDQSTGMARSDISATIKFDRRKYLAGFENGIQVWNGARVVKTYFFNEDELPTRRDRVLNFSQDKNGNVWFSAYENGLGFFDANTYSYSLFPLPDSEFVSYVWANGEELLVAGKEKIYRAVLPAPGRKPQMHPVDVGFPEDEDIGFIRKIGKLKNGDWIVLVAGSPVSTTEVKAYEGLIKVQGYDFLEKNDTIFLGTEKGYFSYSDGKLVPAELLGQSITHPVYAILQDENGFVWLGTDSGVILHERDRLRVFDENTGLLGNDVARGALVQADRGRVFIGTQNGVSVYHPEEDQNFPTSPLVSLDRVAVLDAEPVDTDFLTVPYQLNNIVCSFSAASFLNSPSLLVYYKLEGFHSDWQKVENPRSSDLYFNNLPPGTYRLAMKASLAGYPDSETVYSTEFQIDYPFYFQLWFILLVILFLIALGIGINSFYRQAKHQGVLKNSLNEKTIEIANREDRFRNVWNSSQDGLLLSVMGGQVLAANPNLCKMASVSEKSLQTYGLGHLFADPDYYITIRNQIKGDLQNIDASGYTCELSMPFRSGILEVELYITRMKEDYHGKPLFLNVFRDISSKKAYEQGLKLAKEKAEEVSQLKSSIISNMSHEIRTPLNGILGSTEQLIQNRTGDEELQGHLEIIRESGERLLHTMTSILDLSLIESDRVDLFLEDTNINDFISKILLNHKSIGIKKGILVSTKFATRPFIAKVERRCLEIIVNNIVGNSIKYSEKGMIQIWVEKVGSNLNLQVQDQGVGISQEYLVKLFYPFEQESRGFSRKFEGSGIGLAITRHLVDRLGGHIEVESEKGKGTLVKISLPLEQ
ncbi:PAS domain S-box-containing protein [Cyclobacterium lianum]|uniref:histidine kinase n=1 Tax=Cyclobacterium lianum TaxID=388280 RepID=A0A1M7PDL0_9BACT|nr:ATP-binding protein [Cyclobacterium lianum]SHN15053.1 PAS domain S-box-containing protein [Cyclobacterium lianum]